MAAIKRRRFSLQGYLVLNVIAVLIPLLLFTAFLFSRYYNSELDRIDEDLRSNARELALTLDRDLQGQQFMLQALSIAQLITNRNFAAFHAQATRIRGFTGVDILLRDRFGQQVINTRVPFGSALPPPYTLEGDEEVIRTKKPYITNVVIGGVAQRPLFAITVPVIENDEVTYFLHLSLELGRLAEILSAAIPANRTAGIYDRNFKLMAQTSAPSLGEKFAPESFIKHTDELDDVWRGTDHDGETVRVGTARSKIAGWSIWVSVPEENVQRSLRDTLWTAGAAGLALALFALLVAYALGRQFAGGVQFLSEAAQALGRGTSVPSKESRVKEFDEIANQLVAAADVLGEREAALRQSEQSKAAVINTSLDCIVTINEKGTIVDFNPAAEKTFGFTRTQAVGRLLADLIIPPNYRENHTKGLSRYLSTGEAHVLGKQLEIEAVRADGNRFPVDLAIVETWVDEKRFFTGHLRDISDRKRAEQSLKNMNTELENRVTERTRELTDAYEVLRNEIDAREKAESQIRHMQKLEAVGQLTGGIAHDFNNMLAVILGSLRLMERKLERGETNIHRYIDGAVEGAERAASLTRRLLAFSRQQTLEPQVLDGSKLIAGMSDLLRRAIPENIEIETVLAGGLWRIHADPSQLENAILNLALNARDALPDGGKLTIETANTWLDESYIQDQPDIAVGQYVLVAVTDNGTGMSEETAARAFDPFFTTKSTGRGTGLGLSQVHGFIKQSGGHVKIYSEIGHGTTVKIYLPRYVGETKEVQKEERSADIPLALANERILVVEDDERVRQLAAEMLRELGYEVFEADGATSALIQLDQHSDIALLFTDIVMPGLNGRQLAHIAEQKNSNLKILFATGYTRNAIVHNGVLDSGVNVILKPYTIEALARKVATVLRAGP